MSKAFVCGSTALILAAAIAVEVRAQSVDPDTVVVMSGALRLRGLYWQPAGAGPFPAVLFNHGSGTQLQPNRASRIGPLFARHGYAILYLFRRGAGLSAGLGTDSEVLMGREMAARGQAGRNRIQMRLLERDEIGDVRAGLAWLRRRPEVNPRRVAVVGYSFGGSLSLLLAERDTLLRALVLFSPAGFSWNRSPLLQARLRAAAGRVQAPALFIYAENDYSVASGRPLGAEMDRAHRLNLIKVYPAVGTTPEEGHDFLYSSVSVWESDVFGFLDEQVRSTAR